MNASTTTRSSPQLRASGHSSRELANLLSMRTLIFIGVFVVLAILFHINSGGLFITPRNVSLLLRQGAILAGVASGVAVLMIMSEIDLSIGSAVFLCGVVSAKLATAGNIPLALVVLAALGTGLLLGAIQGSLAVILGIPSFIATLAGLLAFRGVGLLWTNAATVAPVGDAFTALSESFVGVGPSFVLLGVFLLAGLVLIWRRHRGRTTVSVLHSEGEASVEPTSATRLIAEIALLVIPLGGLAWVVGGYLGIPMAVIWVVIITLALSVLMSSTTYGRAGYLLGANREAALYAGIDVRRTVFTGFLIMGILYGLAGVLLTARLGASTPGAGEFMELDAIASAVIGGISLRGGTGTVGGAVMGALLLTTINNGMSILNISSFSQLVIKGVILVVALSLDSYASRKAAR